MDDAKAEFGDLSLTNQYQVHFAGFNQSIIKYLRETGISNAKDYISRKMGIMCADASLPASALATGDVKDNFMGVSQEFAHSRLYTDIDFTFYLSSDYTLLKIFEGWMDYITSGANGEVQETEKSFYRRLRYPDDYKIDTMYIHKFEKDYGQCFSSKRIISLSSLTSIFPETFIWRIITD